MTTISRPHRRLLPMLLLVGLVLIAAVPSAMAHCEIPCGIYGDEMRFSMIDEHLETIAKSMRQITELSADPAANANQLTRWVMNKENHAAELRDILTVYFLDQRIKPVESGDTDAYRRYQAQLETLHRMMVQVMKCKQTTDLAHVDQLRELRGRLYALYFGEDHVPHEH